MVTGRQTVAPTDGWLALAATLTGLKLLSRGTVDVILKADALTPPVAGELGDVLETGDTINFAATTVAYIRTLDSDRILVTYT